jgi:uncharacterized protein with GYD domain
MPTFVLLSRVTDEGAATIKKNPDRILEVNKEIQQFGAKVVHQYATVGSYDFVTIVEAPDLSSVLRVSVELGARGSVRIETLSALPIEEFIRNLH